MFQNPRRHIEIAKISSRANFIRIMRNRFKNLVHETKISKIYVPSSSWNRGSIKIRILKFLRLCPDNRMHSRTPQPTFVRNTRSTTPTKQHVLYTTPYDCGLWSMVGVGATYWTVQGSDQLHDWVFRSANTTFCFKCWLSEEMYRNIALSALKW